MHQPHRWLTQKSNNLKTYLIAEVRRKCKIHCWFCKYKKTIHGRNTRTL